MLNLFGSLWNFSSVTEKIDYKEINGNDANKNINKDNIVGNIEIKSSTISATNGGCKEFVDNSILYLTDTAQFIIL